MADRDIPEEMVEKAAAKLEQGHGLSFRDLTLDQRRLRLRGEARAVLSAALAGRQVVDLPEPDEIYDATAEGRWYTPPDSDSAMTAYLNANGTPEVVTADDDYWSPDDLERDGLARIAAARYARRLAAGSGSGED